MLVNCEWDEWVIGECSVSCAGGKRTNTRTKKVEEANGGECFGEAIALEVCNTQDCPGNWDIMKLL